MGYHLKDRSVRQRGTNLRRVFDANGQPLTESALGNRYLFQGREYSWETGLYHVRRSSLSVGGNFRARWYDPKVGRWLSNDPIGITGALNQYVAFGNNPVVFMDPWGEEFLTFLLSTKLLYVFVGSGVFARIVWFEKLHPRRGGEVFVFEVKGSLFPEVCY